MGPDSFFTFVSIVLAAVSFLIFVGMFVRLGRSARLISAASDLNLEAHAKLLSASSENRARDR